MSDPRLDRTHGKGGAGLRVGTILAAPVDGYVSVQVGGVVELSILRGYTPTVGDSVLVMMQGGTGVVVGALGDAPPGPDTSDPQDIVLEYPEAGEFVFVPRFTGTWRGGSYRDTRDLYQGDASEAGLNFGVAYYGAAPAGSGDVVPTGFAVNVERLTAGPPEPAVVTFWLLPDAYEGGNPATGAVTSFTSPPLTIGRLTTIDLPTAWAEAFADGTAGGVGIYVATATPYVRLAGSRMELRMDWRM